MDREAIDAQFDETIGKVSDTLSHRQGHTQGLVSHPTPQNTQDLNDPRPIR